MAAKVRSDRRPFVSVLLAVSLLWTAVSPAYAFNYGLGSYGAGAYNVGALDPTTTVLTSSTNPSTAGSSITLTATVTPSSATGTVTFEDSATTIGTATLGHASGSLTTSALAAGSHSLTAVYAGNVTYSGSTSNTLTQVVNAAAGGSSGGGGGNAAVDGVGGGGGGGGGHRGTGTTSGPSSAPSSFSASSTSAGSTLLSVTVEGKEVVYRDVPVKAWFAPYVSLLIRQGIAEGYKDAAGHLTGEFGVTHAVTEAEILKIALQAAGRPLTRGVPRNRSARGDWSATYVRTAEELHLSIYVPSLDVRQPATRGQVIQTILEAFGIPMERKMPALRDVPATHPYAAAIATAQALGIVSGDTDAAGRLTGLFRPDAPINRAEVAKIIALVREVVKQ